MSDGLIGEISEPTGLPSALEAEDVLAVVRDAAAVVLEVGNAMSQAEIAQHLVTEMQRRGAGLDRARAQREQQLALQIASITRFHQPYFDKIAKGRALIVEAISAYVPQLVFPKRSKTLQTPYGTVQVKETGGQVRKLTGENAVLADALLDRWAVLNLSDSVVTVYKKVALTPGELKDLKKQLREDMVDDDMAMLPDGLIVERPNATQIKSFAKDTGELPDGMEIAPDETKTIITFDGMASSAIEAVDIALIGENDE